MNVIERNAETKIVRGYLLSAGLYDIILSDIQNGHWKNINALANKLAEVYEEAMPTIQNGVYLSLMNHALREVDWHDLAEMLAEDAGCMGERGQIVTTKE